MKFTLEDIKHGILRGNKRKPGSILRTYYSNDERNMLKGKIDA
jgi:hypothetical protein